MDQIGVKVQLSFKQGDKPLLNIYASNAKEMKSLLTEIIKELPKVAEKFGVTSEIVGAKAATPRKAAQPEPEQPTQEEGRGVADLPPTPTVADAPTPVAANAPAGSAELLSPRDKARARLKGQVA